MDAVSFNFPKLRDHLSGLGITSVLPDQLTAQYKEMRAAGAVVANKRLIQMDSYAGVLPVESLLQVVRTDDALEELEEVHKHNRQAQHLTHLRNLLALFPLLLTWFALWRATSGYQSELAHNPKLIVEPFLVLWERGFDGYLGFPWLTFAATAFLDAVLLGGLIVLTGWLQRRETQARQAARRMVNELEQTLTELTVVLARPTINHNDPQSWASAVQTVIQQAMKQTQQLATENQRTVENARTMVEKIAEQTRTVINDFAEQARDMLVTVRSENAAYLKQVADEGRDMIIEANRQAMGLIQHGVTPLVEQLRTTMGDLAQELNRYHAGTESLVESARTLGNAAGTIADSATRSTNATVSIAGHMEKFEQAQSSFARQVSETAAHMKAASEEMGTLLGQVNGQLAQNIQNIGTNVTSASGQLASVEAGLGRTVYELDKAAERLRQIPQPVVYVSIFPKRPRVE